MTDDAKEIPGHKLVAEAVALSYTFQVWLRRKDNHLDLRYIDANHKDKPQSFMVSADNLAALKQGVAEAIALAASEPAATEMIELGDLNEQSDTKALELIPPKPIINKPLKQLPGKKKAPVGLVTFAVFEVVHTGLNCFVCVKPATHYFPVVRNDRHTILKGIHPECVARYYASQESGGKE